MSKKYQYYDSDEEHHHQLGDDQHEENPDVLSEEEESNLMLMRLQMGIGAPSSHVDSGNLAPAMTPAWMMASEPERPQQRSAPTPQPTPVKKPQQPKQDHQDDDDEAMLIQMRLQGLIPGGNNDNDSNSKSSGSDWKSLGVQISSDMDAEVSAAAAASKQQFDKENHDDVEEDEEEEEEDEDPNIVQMRLNGLIPADAPEAKPKKTKKQLKQEVEDAKKQEAEEARREERRKLLPVVNRDQLIKYISEGKFAFKKNREKDAIQVLPESFTTRVDAAAKEISMDKVLANLPDLSAFGMPFADDDPKNPFNGAGEKPGLEIWKIVAAKAVALPENEHGKFLNGDCFIVLFTNQGQNQADRLRNMHIWMGMDAPLNKRAICAAQAYELSLQLKNKGCPATMYMETQGEETQMFKGLFTQVFYFRGETSSETLRHIEPAQPETKLIKLYLDAKRALCAKRIPLFSKQSFNQKVRSDEVLILSVPDKIFLWFGKDSVQGFHLRAFDVANMIFSEERKGKNCKIVTVEQGEEPADFYEPFFFYKGPDSYNLNEQDFAVLHEIVITFDENDDPKLSLKKTYNYLTTENLRSEASFILETRYELFVRYGLRASMLSRKTADAIARKLSEGEEKKILYCDKFFESCEPVLFQERFNTGFYLHETPTTFEERQKKYLSKICRFKITPDLELDLFEDNKPKSRTSYVDMKDKGLGDIGVFRVINSKEAVQLEEEEMGHFYMGDCYIILYEFDRGTVEYGDEEDEEENDEEKHSDKGSQHSDDDIAEQDPGAYFNPLSLIMPEQVPAQQDEPAPPPENEEAYKEWLLKKSGFANKPMYPVDEESTKAPEASKEEESSTIDPALKLPPKNRKRAKINFLAKRILYAWEGPDSDNKVFTRILRKNFNGLVTDPINPAVLIPCYYGSEDDHFMRIFHHEVVVHKGKHEDAEKTKNNLKLFRIYCKTTLNSRAVEVDKRRSTLNSNDVFLLVGPTNCWLWYGRYASDMKKKLAFKFAKRICTGRDVTAIAEYMEPEEFWDELDDPTALAENYSYERLKYTRGLVYEACVTSEHKYKMFEVGEIGTTFCASDLVNCRNVTYFDFGNAIYVWYPTRQVSDAEKTLARNAVSMLVDEEEEEEKKQTLYDNEEERENAQLDEAPIPEDDKKPPAPKSKYIQEDDDDDGNYYLAMKTRQFAQQQQQKGPKIVEIYAGREPVAFKHAFMDWKSQPKPYIDTFKLKAEQAERDRTARVKKCLPLLQLLRKKFPALITNDEYVNIEVILFLTHCASESSNFEQLMMRLEKVEGLVSRLNDQLVDLAVVVMKYYHEVYNSGPQ